MVMLMYDNADVAEGEVEVDDVEDDEVKGVEDDDVEEEEDNDVEDDDVEEEDRSQDRAHTLCEPAQATCTWTCHKSQE